MSTVCHNNFQTNPQYNHNDSTSIYKIVSICLNSFGDMFLLSNIGIVGYTNCWLGHTIRIFQIWISWRRWNWKVENICWVHEYLDINHFQHCDFKHIIIVNHSWIEQEGLIPWGNLAILGLLWQKMSPHGWMLNVSVVRNKYPNMSKSIAPPVMILWLLVVKKRKS